MWYNLRFRILGCMAFMMIVLSSCSKDDDGDGFVGDSNLPKASYAFFIKGGNSESLGMNIKGKIYNTILFADKDIRDAYKWGPSTKLTTYALDLISESQYDVNNIPTGEFEVGTDCRFYFAINSSYDSEGEIQGYLEKGSILKVKKNGSKYDFTISGEARLYYNEDISTLTDPQPFSFHYEGKIIDNGFTDDDF